MSISKLTNKQTNKELHSGEYLGYEENPETPLCCLYRETERLTTPCRAPRAPRLPCPGAPGSAWSPVSWGRSRCSRLPDQTTGLAHTYYLLISPLRFLAPQKASRLETNHYKVSCKPTRRPTLEETWKRSALHWLLIGWNCPTSCLYIKLRI